MSYFQYSETNVMHFLINLLRIKGLFMFRTLLAHPQEVLHMHNLVYCTRVIFVGCTRIEVRVHQDWSWTSILVQPTDITRTQYTQCRLCSTSWGWASYVRNMYRPLILNKLNKNCITLVSLHWYTMMQVNKTLTLTLLMSYIWSSL
jgi:hypothetical protein